jgi:hypothetical protein
MSNDKQQTAVEWFIEELEYKGDLRETPSIRNIQLNIDTSNYMELKVQAKEREKEIIIKTYIDAKMERNLVKKHFAYFLKLERVTEKAEEYYNKTYNNEQR